jgi:catechol 2,3-dioxygenase-like lactoylglutathione lyase family enzyme
MQRVVPALRIRSYEASRAFYGKLGFKEQWKHQFEPNLPIFASIARDEMEIFLSEHTGDCQFGGLVHFYVPNVDECYAEFQQQGVPINELPSNSLGPDLRDMLVVDPDGNRLSFLTRSAERTSNRSTCGAAATS